MSKSKIKRILTLIIQFILLICFSLWLLGGGLGDQYEDYNTNEALIFAHRGMPDFPENTKISFDSAVNIGFNAIETDVNLTKDNQLVLFHDNNLQRLVGKDKLINEVEYDSLQTEKVIFNGNKSEESIMILADFLNQYNTGNHIYLDIKSSKKVMADQLLDIVEELDSHDNIYVANSNLLFLSYLKYQNPKIKTVLEGFNAGKEWIYYLIPKNYKPTFFASFLSAVDKKHMEWLKEKNLNHRKIVYGIDYGNILQAKEFGIQNIIIDHDNKMGSIKELKNQLR